MQIGAVRLRVADLDAITEFYERVLGLQVLSRDSGLNRLGAGGGRPLVELLAAPGAPRRPAYSTGLFHQAILVPSRADLARALVRLSGAGWRLTGASDHLVSEALYTRDPEGNGIEIYRDRPREDWPRRDGAIDMATLPLDLEGLLAELGPDTADGGQELPVGTRIGHVHLQTGELEPAEAFYHGALGLDVMARWVPGALFLAAGDYHHHVGLNTWETAGAPPPPEGALGLDSYEIVVPGDAERDRLADSLGGMRVRDPDGTTLVLTGT